MSSTTNAIQSDAEPQHCDRPLVGVCHVCKSPRLHYAFSKNSYRIVRCADCRLLMVNPQPSDAELAEIYGEQYFLGQSFQDGQARVTKMKAATARRYLDQIERYRGATGGSLLEVGCGRGELIAVAEERGYDVTGVEFSAVAAAEAQTSIHKGRVICGEIESAALPAGGFDVCVLSDVIEHVRDPLATLRVIHGLLRPGGVLFIATPSLDSWSARLLKQNWMEFKPEHLTFFDTNTIQNALFQGSFENVIVQPGWKILNMEYVSAHFERFPVPVVGRLVRMVRGWMPRSLREADVPVVASGMVALSRSKAVAAKTTLSVVVPAFNEAGTLDALLQSVLRKRIAGVDLEVILVESNSTDGTRDIALRYANHPRVRLVLEDAPRGKGHAVRQGLARATGEFVLIQDADLEYDLEDYDALLHPLIHGREALVLGSRHGGNAWWKMRAFADQRLLSLFTNCGHWFFTTLLNRLFGQRLKDPFTMFKVFRRDCLAGLSFSCNRFDFDIELLVKLIRKGYKPIEIPVNYRSRSYKQGKKVNPLRDPWTWLRAMAKLRLSRLDLMGEIEKAEVRPPRPQEFPMVRKTPRAA